MIKNPFFVPFLAAWMVWIAIGCSSKEISTPPIKRTQFLMGALVEITVPGPADKETQAAVNQAFDEIKRIENLMSSYLPSSEIFLLNNSSGGEFIKVSHEVIKVIREGIKWGEASGGAFDITIGPVVKLWDFDGSHKKVPDLKLLGEAVALVNFRDILIQDSKVRLARPGMALDMGGIAKGYAVDRAIEVLKKKGLSGAIVNAGGDLMAYGEKSPGQPWIIGLQHPRKPDKITISFAGAGQGVATSGDYQKYFMLENQRFHHILNPESGMPVRGVISATVVAPTVMQADALATAAFILGPEKGIALLDSLEGVEGMWIEEGGERIFTNGFRLQPKFSQR
ncbi:MAG: FAD:protein FMN transferase [Nitrospinae bacterium]|nr:FAD:protein FMN transferase [Nitrospinota bacterium]